MTGEREFRYSLIVKADDLDAEKVEQLAIKRGFSILNTASTQSEVILRITAESDQTNALNRWMGEDANDGPPFADGSLLFWYPVDQLP